MKPILSLPDIIQLEYAGQYVLTSKQLAELYNCTADAILLNFRKHKAEFVEDVDYFFVEGAALRELKRVAHELICQPKFSDRVAHELKCQPKPAEIISNYASNVYLWTKSGALKHSDYLSTGKAKEVYVKLALGYFKTETEPSEQAEPEPAKASARLDLLMEMIRLTKNDDLRDKLIREAAELVLGKKV